MSGEYSDKQSVDAGLEFEHWSLTYGLLLLTYTVPMLGFSIQALPAENVARWWFIPVVQFDWSIQLFPPLESGEFDAWDWVWSVFWDLVVSIFGIGYYLALAAAGVGLLLTCLGSILITGPRAIGKTIWTAASLRPVQIVVSLYSAVGVGVFFPIVFRLIVELLLVLVIAAPITAGLGIAWLRLRSSGNTVIRVFILYPIAVGVVVLPTAVTALASPTFGPWFRTASSVFATFILDTALAVGGLNEWIRASFTLTGINYVLMWLGLALIIGWSLGIVIERFASQSISMLNRS